jgi:membrane protease YdiL (CAAX protease family)
VTGPDGGRSEGIETGEGAGPTDPAPEGGAATQGVAPEPRVPPAELPHNGPRPYAPTWSIPAALALVAAFVLLNALGGSTVVLLQGSDLGGAVQSAAAFGAIILAQAVVVGIAWWSARRGGVPFARAVRLVPPRMPAWGWIAVGYAVGARLLATVWAVVIEALGWTLPGQDIDPTRLLPEGMLGLVLTAVLVVVAAPFAEEVVFRGILVPSLATRYSVALAIWVAATLFALVHFNAFSTLPVLLAGWAFGRLLARSGSVWPSIVAHATFNATGFAALLLYRALGLA